MILIGYAPLANPPCSFCRSLSEPAWALEILPSRAVTTTLTFWSPVLVCDPLPWNAKQPLLLTGVLHQPFGNNRINPSHLIASSLPSSFTTKEYGKVNIIKASPVPALYEAVRDLVPKLLFPDGSTGNVSAVPQNNTSVSPLPRRNATTTNGQPIDKPRYDLVLHIGMAPGRKYFTLEKRAHRDGYNAKDEDGDSLEDDTWFRDQFNAPELLTPGFDTDDLWRRWKSELLVRRGFFLFLDLLVNSRA